VEGGGEGSREGQRQMESQETRNDAAGLGGMRVTILALWPGGGGRGSEKVEKQEGSDYEIPVGSDGLSLGFRAHMVT
jgi:hypothetical protein